MNKRKKTPWGVDSGAEFFNVIDQDGTRIAGEILSVERAALLASAPELLEALKDLVETMTGRSSGATAALHKALVAINDATFTAALREIRADDKHQEWHLFLVEDGESSWLISAESDSVDKAEELVTAVALDELDFAAERVGARYLGVAHDGDVMEKVA